MSERASQEVADDNLLTTLSSLEGAVNYRNWLLRLARPYLAAPVLEVGAGRGTFTPFLAATGGTLAVIPYREAAQPLRGEPRRLQRRELGDPRAVLGAFAGLRCADLRCDWPQSLCRPADDA